MRMTSDYQSNLLTFASFVILAFINIFLGYPTPVVMYIAVMYSFLSVRAMRKKWLRYAWVIIILMSYHINGVYVYDNEQRTEMYAYFMFVTFMVAYAIALTIACFQLRRYAFKDGSSMEQINVIRVDKSWIVFSAYIAPMYVMVPTVSVYKVVLSGESNWHLYADVCVLVLAIIALIHAINYVDSVTIKSAIRSIKKANQEDSSSEI